MRRVEILRHAVGHNVGRVGGDVDDREIVVGDSHKKGDQVSVGSLSLISDRDRSGDRTRRLLVGKFPSTRSGDVDTRHRRESLGLHEVRIRFMRVVGPLGLGQQGADALDRAAHTVSSTGTPAA